MGEPVWALATLFPDQGDWTEDEYLAEIVSDGPDDRARDLVRKRHEYAAAGVRESWLVEPDAAALTVLALEHGRYVEHGVYRRGDVARSRAFAGLDAE